MARSAAENTNRHARYGDLARAGILHQRVNELRRILACCNLCPRNCGVDRIRTNDGRCGLGSMASVSAAFPHFGEEAVLTGRKGSGTVFLAGCNLGCAFCQNGDLRQASTGRSLEPSALADIFLSLQAEGCENINLVTPTPSVPALVQGIEIAAGHGLHLPIVFNTSSYDSPAALQLLDGVVDIYLADFKTDSPGLARLWMDAPDYPKVARDAMGEMHRQVGDLELDERGVAVRGLLVRHLVMPGNLDDTRSVVGFLSSLSPDTAVNIMDQYRPLAEAGRIPGLSTRPDSDEIRAAKGIARSAGLRLITR